MLDGREYLDGCARKGLDVVDQTIASGSGCLWVGGGNRVRQIRVQTGCERQVRRLLVVHIPKAAGQTVGQANGPICVLIVRGGRDQLVQGIVQTHETKLVVLAFRATHTFGNFAKLHSFVACGPNRAGSCEQALELPSNLEQQQLAARIDFGDQNALARQNF